MESKLINLLPENWLQALGSTLFHSLWEGIILALFTAVMMFVTRKASASLRYHLLTGFLALFVLAIFTTFYFELEKKDAVIISQSLIAETGNHLTIVNDQHAVNVSAGNIIVTGAGRLQHLWSVYSLQIVVIWFLIICAKSIQLLAGLNGIYHVKHHQVYSAGKIWDEQLEALSLKLGLTQQVKLLQSGIAKVPMALGHFKPLILLPLGLLNGLSDAEVEAILAHELAHIKRHDFLVNLLQSFIEIIFFFNPAVLWVSQLIKTEREHCCDDLAIACVNDRKDYVKALISCQEFKQCAPAFAMGITGQKSSLLHRVSRMLFNTQPTLNKMEKTILTIALVSTVIGAAAFKSVDHTVKLTGNKNLLVQQDTAKKNKPVENKSSESLENKIEQKIKAEEQKSDAQQKARNKKQNQGEKEYLEDQEDARQVEAEAKKSAAEVRRVADEKQYAAANQKYLQEQAKYAEKEKKYKQNELNYAKDQKRWAEEDAKWAKEDAKWAEQDKKWAEENKKGNVSPRAPRPPRPARIRTAAVPPLPPTPPTPPIPGTPGIPGTPPTPPTPPAVPGRTTKTSSEHTVTSTTVTNGDGRDYTSEINQQLLKDKIISNTNNLSYRLNKDELIVNGVKQNAELQKKYKSKFLKHDGHSLMYNYAVERSSSN